MTSIPDTIFIHTFAPTHRTLNSLLIRQRFHHHLLIYRSFKKNSKKGGFAGENSLFSPNIGQPRNAFFKLEPELLRFRSWVLLTLGVLNGQKFSMLTNGAFPSSFLKYKYFKDYVLSLPSSLRFLAMRFLSFETTLTRSINFPLLTPLVTCIRWIRLL